MTFSPLQGPIGQVHVTVSDIGRAVSFYRDVLGLEFLFQVPDKPMAFFKDPDENVLAVMEERAV